MKHKWLEDIGVHSYSENNFGSIRTFKELLRHIKFSFKRRRTGVDPRDGWNLDNYFYRSLYEHLMQYKEDASEVVDLEYIKLEYKDTEYTQLELINILCEKLKEMILWDGCKGTPELGEYKWIELEDGTRILENSETEEVRKEFQRIWLENANKCETLKDEIFEIWRLLIDHMWW